MAALVKSIFGGKSDKELKELQQKYDIKFEETKVDPANVFDNDFSSIIDPKWEIDRSKLERFPRNVDAFTIPIFSDQESRDIIKLTEKIQYGPCGYPKGYRSNSRIIVNDPALAKPLYERIKQIAPEFVYQNRGKQEKWEICGLNERFRYCRYITGQHFGTHCDANFRRRSDEISFYTVNIYLNDYNSEFTGGRTLFYDYLENGKYSVSNEIEPKAGLALIFNHTTERYAHCGEKLKSGVKYIMRTDIMYRRYDEKKRKREEEKMRLIKEREEKEKLKQMKDEEKDEAIKELQAKKKLLQQSQNNNNNNNNNDNNNVDGTSNSSVGDAGGGGGGDSSGVVANNNDNKEEDDGDLLVETKMAGNNEDDEYNNDARMGNGHIVDERDDKMENNGDVMMDDGRNEYGDNNDNNDNNENNEANATGQDSEMMANGQDDETQRQELSNDEAPVAAAVTAVTADASGDNEATNTNEDNTYGDQDNHVQTEDNNNDNDNNDNKENSDIAANGNDNENNNENTDANVAIHDDNNDDNNDNHNDGNADADARTDAADVADGGAADVEINDNHDEP